MVERGLNKNFSESSQCLAKGTTVSTYTEPSSLVPLLLKSSVLMACLLAFSRRSRRRGFRLASFNKVSVLGRFNYQFHEDIGLGASLSLSISALQLMPKGASPTIFLDSFLQLDILV